ncbi:MAG: putative nuclease [Prokaryotic dsDNA virus sp.]|nr:nuclease [Cytophagaceae bacterium]QDP54344.1 MAG: putative nuclease [Prokaryotic dsDNA virus sp.]|tara:strand:- start:6335 stop:6622 length:288 start_codon:yes stop_codon:yes gene_type:complete
MRESKIERDFCKYATKSGCIAYKFSSPARRGVPDRLIVCPNGVSFFIEFKNETGNLSVMQLREIQKLRDRGQRVYVCDHKGQAETILDLELTGAV